MASFKKILGLPLWGGIAAIVAIIALIFSFIDSGNEKDTAPNSQVISNGNQNTQIQGQGNNVQR